MDGALRWVISGRTTSDPLHEVNGKEAIPTFTTFDRKAAKPADRSAFASRPCDLPWIVVMGKSVRQCT